MRSDTVRLRNERDMEIAGIITHPDEVEHDDPADQRPGVILSHSFTGYKEIPHLKALADRLASEGFIALRFDFTDCVGESDGTCEDMKLSNQITDLKSALSFFESRGDVDEKRVGLAGHSLGGMTSILVAAEDDRPSALVPIAAPANAECEKLFQGNEIDRWERAGHIHFPTYKRGEVKIGWQFYEDLQQYDALDAMPDIDIPVRFVHGTDDDIVPLSNSESMYDRSNDPRDLKRVEGADHLFSGKKAQDAMVEATADWFVEHL